jgi:hypothetical protein
MDGFMDGWMDLCVCAQARARVCVCVYVCVCVCVCVCGFLFYIYVVYSMYLFQISSKSGFRICRWVIHVQSCPVTKLRILIHIMLKHRYLMDTGGSGGKVVGV